MAGTTEQVGREGFAITWERPPLLVCRGCGKSTEVPSQDGQIAPEDLADLEGRHRCSTAASYMPWDMKS